MGCGYSKIVSLDAGQHKKGIKCFKLSPMRKRRKTEEFQALG